MENMAEEKEKIYCMKCAAEKSKQQVVKHNYLFLSLIILQVKIYSCILILKHVNPNGIHLTHNSMNLILMVCNSFIKYI